MKTGKNASLLPNVFGHMHKFADNRTVWTYAQKYQCEFPFAGQNRDDLVKGR
jgi:hypothetical protein